MINWDEPIECKLNGVWYDAEVKYLGNKIAVVSYCNDEVVYNLSNNAWWLRNKQREPEEKWRPFKENELDLLFGQVLGNKTNHKDRTMIVRIFGKVVQIAGGWKNSDELFEYFDLRQPDGKWGPCGVKEQCLS